MELEQCRAWDEDDEEGVKLSLGLRTSAAAIKDGAHRPSPE